MYLVGEDKEYISRMNKYQYIKITIEISNSQKRVDLPH